MKKWNTKANSIPIMRSISNLICGCKQASQFSSKLLRTTNPAFLYSQRSIRFSLIFSGSFSSTGAIQPCAQRLKPSISKSVSSMARGGNRKLRYSFRRWNNQVWQCQISRYPKQQFELDQLPVQRKILAALRLHQQKIWISRCIRWPHNKTCVFKTKMWVW